MKLIIQAIPPSLNKVLRMHWTAKRELHVDWLWLLKAAWPSGALCDGKRRVKITLYHSRFYDKDNAYGACKVIFDVLKEQGFIVDDAPQWLEASVEQQKCKRKESHTIIEVGAA